MVQYVTKHTSDAGRAWIFLSRKISDSARFSGTRPEPAQAVTLGLFHVRAGRIGGMATAALIWGVNCGLVIALAVFVTLLYVVPAWRIIRDIEQSDSDPMPNI